MSMLLDGTNGVTFNDSSLQGAAASPYVLKNRIINGDMRIAQRGTSFTSVGNGTSAPQYTLDRMFGYRGSGWTANLDISQQTGFSNFSNCIRIQRTSGTSSLANIVVGQVIESVNMADLAGQTVTFSIYARSGSNYSGGPLSLQIQTSTATNQSSLGIANGTWTGSANSSSDVTLSTTAARYTFTLTIPVNAASMAFLLVWTPTGTAGANDFIEVTGVQLEIGSTATPFERRLYNQELANCQRYFQTVANGPGGSCNLTTSCLFGFQFPVVMRTAPSSAVTGAIRVSDISTSAFTQSSGTIANNLVTSDGGSFILGNFTGMTINRPILLAQMSSGTIQLSAEL